MVNDDDCQILWENFLSEKDYVKLRRLEFVFQREDKIQWILNNSQTIQENQIKQWFQVLKKAMGFYPQYNDDIYLAILKLPINSQELITWKGDFIASGSNYSDEVFLHIIENNKRSLNHTLSKLVSDYRMPLNVLQDIINEIISQDRLKMTGHILKNPHLTQKQVDSIIDYHEKVGFIPKACEYPNYANYNWLFKELKNKNHYNPEEYSQIINICQKFTKFQQYILLQNNPELIEHGLIASPLEVSLEKLENNSNA